MTPSIQIRPMADDDWDEWLRMSHALFPGHADSEMTHDMRTFRARPDAEVFVAARTAGGLGGFVEVGERPYADGCDTSPVGYIEAWYVDDDLRRTGVGRALIAAAEAWARARGYQEMASDALLDNTISHRAHEALGYGEVERAVRFRKVL